MFPELFRLRVISVLQKTFGTKPFRPLYILAPLIFLNLWVGKGRSEEMGRYGTVGEGIRGGWRRTEMGGEGRVGGRGEGTVGRVLGWES